jgi:hypothetical protein
MPATPARSIAQVGGSGIGVLEASVIVGMSKIKSGSKVKTVAVASVGSRPKALQGANRAIDAPAHAKTGMVGSDAMKSSEEDPPVVLNENSEKFALVRAPKKILDITSISVKSAMNESVGFYGPGKCAEQYTRLRISIKELIKCYRICLATCRECQNCQNSGKENFFSIFSAPLVVEAAAKRQALHRVTRRILWDPECVANRYAPGPRLPGPLITIESGG